MKIALVGPGYMPIPSVAWGACESIIWAFYTRLKDLGHEVTLYNDIRINNVIDGINNNPYDFVFCDYDDHVGILSKYCNKPIWGRSHYGRIKTWRQDNPGYGFIHQGMMEATGGIISLSKGVADIYRQDGYKGPIHVLRNGADVKSIRFAATPTLPRAICVGKIEPRKCQARLAKLCDGKVEINFVGPMHDPDFRSNSTCRWLGEWSREQLYENLTNYSCLVLASTGENDPLVTKEAIAAGLSLAITKTCDANIDQFVGQYLDWEKSEWIPSRINYAIELGKLEQIRKFHRNWAENHFDWDIIVREMESLICEIVNKK